MCVGVCVKQGVCACVWNKVCVGVYEKQGVCVGGNSDKEVV